MDEPHVGEWEMAVLNAFRALSPEAQDIILSLLDMRSESEAKDTGKEQEVQNGRTRGKTQGFR